MKCAQCGKEFEGTFCSNCGTPATAQQVPTNSVPEKTKKPLHKKWWFWVIIVLVLIVIIGSVAGNGDDAQETSGGNSSAATVEQGAKVTVIDFSSMSKESIESWAAENAVTVRFEDEYSDTVEKGGVISQDKKANETINTGSSIKVVLSKGKKVSIEYQNALKKAESYSKTMHMSKKGIYDQLTSEYGEQFPADAAQYAVDNMNADWNENALEKAKSYQKTMSMSKSAIYDQLISEYGEKFTAEEAQYAIDHLDD